MCDACVSYFRIQGFNQWWYEIWLENATDFKPHGDSPQHWEVSIYNNMQLQLRNILRTGKSFASQQFPVVIYTPWVFSMVDIHSIRSLCSYNNTSLWVAVYESLSQAWSQFFWVLLLFDTALLHHPCHHEAEGRWYLMHHQISPQYIFCILYKLPSCTVFQSLNFGDFDSVYSMFQY